MSKVVAVDIGGTFTDLVAYDPDTQRITCIKSPTDYADFVAGILDCFGMADLDPGEMVALNHGTTLVINALLERKGTKTALVTTKGFRDILEIARGNRPDPFDLRYARDEPLVPRELRFEIGERVNSTGEIVQAVDADELAELARTLRDAGVDGVAIFFINSYANPAPERYVAERLSTLLPGIYVTCSVDLTGEWYEYERCATVAANAYVGPNVSTYIGHLQGKLTERDFKGAFHMMGSNGGLMSANEARRRPIALVESGPVGGCIGAAAYASALDIANVIAFDMGGTTAKCAHIAEGRFAIENLYHVGGYIKGFPVRSAVLDIAEVGSGGGSIARLDAYGRLSVGPESAGSTPGPACYGRGGIEPTITDANLILGRLNPQNFAGGQLKLDVEAARNAIASVAMPLGYTGADGLHELAEGMITLSTIIMADAVKQVSINQGLDPRDFVLFCYGGGGPLHASALARELSIPTIIVPPEPGNFSALGMLLSDARLDLSETFVRRLEPGLTSELEQQFMLLEDRAREMLAPDFSGLPTFIERFVEMRFIGQRHSIKIPFAVSPMSFDPIVAFSNEYRRRYGHASEAAAETQALHISAFVRSQKPDLANLLERDGAVSPMTRRKAFFGAGYGWSNADVYARRALARGFSTVGPALIEEYGSTTLVLPGDRVSVGSLGELRIDCAS